MTSRIDWTATPADHLRPVGIPILRCPGSRPITFLCLSRQYLGVHLHFHRGRTVPHVEPRTECEPCQDPKTASVRWRGYLAAQLFEGSKLAIVEFTSATEPIFKQWLIARETLRGTAIKLWRPSRRANGRLEALIKQASERDCHHLPEEFHLQPILLRIWDGKSKTPKPQHDTAPHHDIPPQITSRLAHDLDIDTPRPHRDNGDR